METMIPLEINEKLVQKLYEKTREWRDIEGCTLYEFSAVLQFLQWLRDNHD